MAKVATMLSALISRVEQAWSRGFSIPNTLVPLHPEYPVANTLNLYRPFFAAQMCRRNPVVRNRIADATGDAFPSFLMGFNDSL